ncbi:MAG: response regulator transcription factor [Kangiellaceae bacterium]
MSQQTLLIVDDSRLSRMLVRNFAVETLPGLNLIEAENGDEALSVVEGKNIDLMTIDYNMPGMDGITLAVKLRLKYPEANIALLTANIQSSIRKQANEVGIDFIQKPITQEKIENYLTEFA